MNPATQSAFGLYLVLTEPVAGYEACADAAVRAGLRYVQLRRKNKPRPETLDIARRLRRITAGSATLFIVNDDVEIAAEIRNPAGQPHQVVDLQEFALLHAGGLACARALPSRQRVSGAAPDAATDFYHTAGPAAVQQERKA